MGWTSTARTLSPPVTAALLMSNKALLPFAQKGVSCHYLANIDGSEFHELVGKLRAETTLFIVSSKTFGTLETLKNAQAARAWYLAQGGSEDQLHRHLACVGHRDGVSKGKDLLQGLALVGHVLGHDIDLNVVSRHKPMLTATILG